MSSLLEGKRRRGPWLLALAVALLLIRELTGSAETFAAWPLVLSLSFALVSGGYIADGVRTGVISGRFGSFDRREDPHSFRIALLYHGLLGLFCAALAIVFLVGHIHDLFARP